MVNPFVAIDVDGSIFKSSLVEITISKGITAGLFDADAFVKAEEYKRQWQHDNNEEVYQAYLHHLVSAFVAQMAGVEVITFDAVVQQVIHEHGVRRFGFPRKLLSALRGHYAIAISGSPYILVRLLLQDLDIQAIYGSRFEVVDGKFTGKAEAVSDKAAIIEKLMHDEVVQQPGSVALGDTISDASMLALAEYPIMFNASRTLLNYGTKQHWPRVHEVKDQVTVLVYDAHHGGYVEQESDEFIASVASYAR